MGKSTFFTGQPVFLQLLNLIPASLFDKVSSRHRADHYCKKFMARDHLVSMLYACFFQCTSIRELVTGLQANSSRLEHLGLKYTPRRSTLADANARRSPEFFADMYQELYKRYFLPDSRRCDDRLFIIDSTTISLFTSVMKGAGSPGANGKKKGGLKAHMMMDSEHDVPAIIDLTEARRCDLVFMQKLHVPDNSVVVFDMGYVNYKNFKEWGSRGIRWITRQKSLAYVEVLEQCSLSEVSINRGVLKDEKVRLGRPSNERVTPLIGARRIAFHDELKNRDFLFITNDFESSPEAIADLYKKRWQIELLFKRIKQRYPLKYFLGDNANAIQVQVWCALICDLLVKIIQNMVNRTLKKKWAYSSIFGMIKHHLMTYINLFEFLKNPERALINYKPPPSQLSLF
ncbi:MAG: IS4 family transposase [Flavobacteriales bacterium]|jgi:hypothetical protein